MNTKLNHVQDWLELARQVNWSVTKAAKLCNVSSRTLERFFLKNFGKSPKIWLKEQRQQQAERLLKNGSSVKEIAAVLGFSDFLIFPKSSKKITAFARRNLAPKLKIPLNVALLHKISHFYMRLKFSKQQLTLK